MDVAAREKHPTANKIRDDGVKNWIHRCWENGQFPILTHCWEFFLVITLGFIWIMSLMFITKQWIKCYYYISLYIWEAEAEWSNLSRVSLEARLWTQGHAVHLHLYPLIPQHSLRDWQCSVQQGSAGRTLCTFLLGTEGHGPEKWPKGRRFRLCCQAVESLFLVYRASRSHRNPEKSHI